MIFIILQCFFNDLASYTTSRPERNRFNTDLNTLEFYDGHVDYIQRALLNKGVYTFYRDNNLFIAPPLTISESELRETLQKINEVLMFVYSHC